MEIRAVGFAAADRAYARIQARFARERVKSQDMRLTFYRERDSVCPPKADAQNPAQDVSEPKARYVPLD